LKSIHLLPLGGAREIGANSYFLNFDGHGVLIDAGLHPERMGWDAFPKADLLEPSAVNTFFITHAHTDHLGAVPFMLQSQPQARVIATKETIEIARIMLANTASLFPRQHPKSVIDQLPFYTEEKLGEILDSIEPRRFGSVIELKDGLKATFYMSGHILGAAGILFEFGGKRIFHTGDTKMLKQQITAGAELPDQPVDILISESTNGQSDELLEHSREEELARFSETLNDVLTSGGSVLIPVFALGKMQEMVVTIWELMKKKLIPEVDLYTGGMGRRITQIYDMFRYSDSRCDQDTVIADIPQLDVPRRDGLFSGKFFKTPSIVLASSGMMQEGTSSYLLAQRWLRHESFAICFIGYTDPRTPGHAVQHAIRGKRVRFGSMKREVPVKCRIERFRFSAHARRNELIEIVERLKPKHVVLTHGDIQAMNAYSEILLERFSGMTVSAPEVGKLYKLSD
jgi:cleavage and polyadenylation specificity factor subunit 3